MYKIRIRDISIAIVFLLGFFFIVEYFIKWPVINTFANNTLSGGTVVAGLAAIIGVGTLTLTHGKNIIRRGENWMPSVVLFVTLWGALLIGLISSSRNPTYSWIFAKVQTPISVAYSSLLAFFILSGAFRAFKAKTLEGAAMTIVCILVFMGNATVTGSIWPGFQGLQSWLMDIGQTAGSRGLIISIAIGVVVSCLRILLAREKGYLLERGTGK